MSDADDDAEDIAIRRAKAGRLKLARIAAGYKTAREFADKNFIPQPTYAMHESGDRGLRDGVAARYARILSVSDAWLTTGEGQGPGSIGSNMFAPPPPGPASRSRASMGAGALEEIEVIGAVQAGHWLEAIEWPHDERFRVEIPVDPRFAHLRKIGLRVVGNSMNRVYPPGSILIVVGFVELKQEPRSGDRIIVHRRRRDGLTEVTVKELAGEGSTRLLCPRSTSPEFQTSLILDDPGEDDQNEDIHLSGLVIDSIPPLAGR